MSDLLVAFITTTSILSDMSAAEKEEVVAFMQNHGYGSISWDKIRYVSCPSGPAKLPASPDIFPAHVLLILNVNRPTLEHHRVFSFPLLLSNIPFTPHNIKRSKMGPKNNQVSQKWDEPALVKDLLAATVDHLNPSKQDILQIATKAKAMGGWHFTESAC
ncbi:hypothetical protein F5883DRAFT_643161 [Diaporthe sp. PMI_573]|jgi:hypothetical protein|nr:hypothetical protein F5883DRAFT_643161 [Diaporthaceae sp. PMI_573]